MPTVRTVYVPRFGSQLGSSQRDKPVPDRATQTEYKRGNKRGGKSRFLLKVKLQNHNNSLPTKVPKAERTPKRRMVEPSQNKGGDGTDSDSVGQDAFFFSQRPSSPPINEKDKAKLAVLRTISKMQEENQLIRQRLAAFSQAN